MNAALVIGALLVALGVFVLIAIAVTLWIFAKALQAVAAFLGLALQLAVAGKTTHEELAARREAEREEEALREARVPLADLDDRTMVDAARIADRAGRGAQGRQRDISANTNASSDYVEEEVMFDAPAPPRKP